MIKLNKELHKIQSGQNRILLKDQLEWLRKKVNQKKDLKANTSSSDDCAKPSFTYD